MRFRGQILGLMLPGTVDSPPKKIPEFIFSRKLIHFPSGSEKNYYTDFFLHNYIHDKSDYTFSKEYDKEDRKRFVITFAVQIHSACLKLNWWNRIKCNLVHKRYIFQRDPDWFWKSLIAGGIGAVFGFIGGKVGYKSGFQDGIKYTKSQSRDTLPESPSRNSRTVPAVPADSTD